jgi:hypothetical protein
MLPSLCKQQVPTTKDFLSPRNEKSEQNIGYTHLLFE